MGLKDSAQLSSVSIAELLHRRAMLVGCSGKAGVAYQIVSNGRTKVVLCIQSAPLKRQRPKRVSVEEEEGRGGTPDCAPRSA